MVNYKRYKLQYVLFVHDINMSYSRVFKTLEQLESYLEVLKKNEKYVKSNIFEMDITEREIKV